MPAERAETDDDAGATQQENPDRHGRSLPDDTALGDADHRRDGADRISHIVGAVSERHAASRNDHEHAEHAFDGRIVEAPLGLLIHGGAQYEP